MTDALDWHVFKCVTLTEEATTGASRRFLKILFLDLAENMGLKELTEKLNDPEMQEYFVGLFPKDHPLNTRFAINYFSVIGLESVIAPLREFLAAEVQLNQDELARLNAESSSTSSSSDSSDSDSDRNSSSSSKELEKSKSKSKSPVKRKERKEDKDSLE